MTYLNASYNQNGSNDKTLTCKPYLAPEPQSGVSNNSTTLDIKIGRTPGIRTQNIRSLNPTPLPVGLESHMVLPAGFEPAMLGP